MQENDSTLGNSNNNKSVNLSSKETIANSSLEIKSAKKRAPCIWSGDLVADVKYNNDVIFENPTPRKKINSTSLTKSQALKKPGSSRREIYLTGLEELNSDIGLLKYPPLQKSVVLKSGENNVIFTENKKSNNDILPSIFSNRRSKKENKGYNFSCCDQQLKPYYLNELYMIQNPTANTEKFIPLSIKERKIKTRSPNKIIIKEGPRDYIQRTNQVNRIRYCLNLRNEGIRLHRENLQTQIRNIDRTINKLHKVKNGIEKSFSLKYTDKLREINESLNMEKSTERELNEKLSTLKKEVNILQNQINKVEFNKHYIEKWLKFQILLKEGKSIELTDVKEYMEKYNGEILFENENDIELFFKEKENKNLRLLDKYNQICSDKDKLKKNHEEVKKEFSDESLSMELLEKQKLLALVKKRNEQLNEQKNLMKKEIQKLGIYSSINKDEGNKFSNKKMSLIMKDININNANTNKYSKLFDKIKKIYYYIMKNDKKIFDQINCELIFNYISTTNDKNIKAIQQLKIIELCLDYLYDYLKDNTTEENAQFIQEMMENIDIMHKKMKSESIRREKIMKDFEYKRKLEEKTHKVYIKPTRRIDNAQSFLMLKKKKNEEKKKIEIEVKKELELFDFLFDAGE